MEAMRFEWRSQEGADFPIGQRSSETYLRKARNGHLEQSPNDSGQKGGSGTGKKFPVEQKWDLKERHADWPVVRGCGELASSHGWQRKQPTERDGPRRLWQGSAGWMDETGKPARRLHECPKPERT